MSAVGATGPAQDGDTVAGNMPADRQLTRTELEMEAGRKRNDHYANLSTHAPASGGNAILPVAAAATKQAQPTLLRQQTNGAASVILSSNQPLTDQIARFIARVVPWPDEGASGFINLHYTKPDRDGMPGHPFRKVEDFVAQVRLMKDRPAQYKDIYFCLSSQAKLGKTINGKAYAARHAEDALALKAIWLDIDVKEPPNGYANIQEAWAALKDFYTSVGLPMPSALISSGGGLHVYWISKTPLTPDQWRPLAGALKNAALKHGLRCDAGCTVDAARVLRVPGTWNCKTEPRRPVQLLGLGEDYDF